MGSISGHTLNLRFVQGSGFTRSLRPIRDWGSMDREGMQQPGSRVQIKGRKLCGYKVPDLQLLENALDHAWSNIMHNCDVLQ
ncbi:hypothetical protein DAI22_01g301700 [Oryza sativa Japonica Group]|nr:hypothetical protein DAI22_01g301700 [Oryza sativa Japonica Group]